jgi:hypothetical protein
MSSSYIGRSVDAINNISSLDVLTFNGSDATFNLTQNGVAFTPVSADALQIQIDGIIQSGNFSVSSSTVTFDFTPNSGSVCNSVKHFGVGLLSLPSDGSVTTAKLGADAVTTAKINDGAVTSGKIASGVIPTSRPNANAIIVNGDMAVAQRGTSVSTTAGGYKTVDRLQFNTSSTTGNATFTQENDAPSNTGFRKSMKITPNATETMSASKNILFTYALEGQDVQVLQHGSASPPKATLSFWVKSNKTGAYSVQVKEETIANESYVLFEYTISQANTWEQKVFSWTGNSAHTLNNDNTMGFRLCWHLASGSDDHASATTSWVVESTYKTTANQVNFFDSTSNTWYITGIQLEVGEYTSATLPPFQHESFGENLERCRRYYEKSYAHDVAIGTNTYADQNFSDGDYTNQSNNEISHGFIYKTSKRITPSITVYDHAGTSGKCNRWQFGVTIHSNQSVQVDNQGAEACRIKSPSGNTAALISYHYTANSEL